MSHIGNQRRRMARNTNRKFTRSQDQIDDDSYQCDTIGSKKYWAMGMVPPRGVECLATPSRKFLSLFMTNSMHSPANISSSTRTVPKFNSPSGHPKAQDPRNTHVRESFALDRAKDTSLFHSRDILSWIVLVPRGGKLNMGDNGSHGGLVNGGKISRLGKSGKIQYSKWGGLPNANHRNLNVPICRHKLYPQATTS
jgi:hypothetical protein